MKKLLIGLAVLVILYVGVRAVMPSQPADNRLAEVDVKNLSYEIEGVRVQLVNGRAETETAPGAASKTSTQYFGNELRRDLNGDGVDDVVFLVTQQGGGSGTFYYVVAAVSSERGYVGSQAMLIGDRIAPQTTELSQNPRHQNVIVINYADRAPGQDFSVQPSVGKSMWVKLDPERLQFGEVVQNFEGESNLPL